MELSAFKIRQLVFEVRYDDAFLLWDCAGRVHAELAKLWPGSKLVQSEANQQLLKSDDAEIMTGIRQAHVAVIEPSTITKFADQIAETLRIWTSAMNVGKFNRVGTRVIYTRKYSSEEASDQAVMDLELIQHPPPPFFNHKVEPYTGEITITWRDDTTQTRFLAKSEHQSIEVPNLEKASEKQKQAAHFLIVDIDRATRGTVDLAKFRVREWLDGVAHLISRDVPKLIAKG
jgi:hypothetical protein